MPPQLRQLDVGQALQAFTTGQDRAAVRQRRNVFRQAGSALAAGDEAGAAASLLEAGELETGIQLQNLSTQRKKALIDNIAAGAVAADTPEKWQRFIQRSGQVFGENTVAQFRDFSSRDGVIAQSLGAKGQLDLQFKRESAARDRERLDLERQRVGTQTQLAQEKIKTLQAKRSATVTTGAGGVKADGKPATGKFVTLTDQAGKTRTVREDSALATELVNQGFQPPDPASVEGRKAERKAEVKNQAELKGRAQGAQGFLQKIERVRNLIAKGGDDLFGPIQGSPLSPTRAFGKAFGTQAERQRQLLQSQLSNLELDVAKFKLKGQGQVTEAERAIARETLPKTTTLDAATASKILDELEAEAREAIEAERRGDTTVLDKPETNRQGSTLDNPVSVTTPQEAADLPAGTFFRTPDGRTIQRR